MYADNVLRSYERQGFFSGYKEDRQTKVREGIRDFLLRIPHHALIYMEKDPDKRKYDEDYAAVCAYIQNVQLLAWESGVGVLWTTNPYLYDSEFVRDIGLIRTFTVSCLCCRWGIRREFLSRSCGRR